MRINGQSRFSKFVGEVHWGVAPFRRLCMRIYIYIKKFGIIGITSGFQRRPTVHAGCPWTALTDDPTFSPTNSDLNRWVGRAGARSLFRDTFQVSNLPTRHMVNASTDMTNRTSRRSVMHGCQSVYGRMMCCRYGHLRMTCMINMP